MDKFCVKGYLKRSGKRVLSILLCACMIGTMIPITARAETEGTSMPSNGEVTCTCANLCTEDKVNSDCPVCGAEEADLSKCTGKVQSENNENQLNTGESEEKKNETELTITGWEWIDEEELINPETGILALPFANEETPAFFDDVVALLPTQIQATVVNEEDIEAEAASETITLGDWSCEEYPKEGAYSGSYTFAAALPEGYVLSEEDKALTVLVELGGAQMYESVEGVIVGDFTVTGGTLGTDYTYADGVLTIKSDMALTIANTDPSTATSNRIEVAEWVDANITLAGVNIDVSSMSDTAAFKIADDSTGNVTITLADGSENTLKSGYGCAGLQKNGEGENIGKLTIQGGTNGTGKLIATGGLNGAGIGGGNGEGGGGNGSNIEIKGGTVTATGGLNGAGIGGGKTGSGSYITISGGTVEATVDGNYGAGIGGGNGGAGSYITISGGTVTATSSYYGAGIGGGCIGSGSYIEISGGTVTATGGTEGAGMGGGRCGTGSDITISGGTVTATGSNGGAGIGGGYGYYGSNITISGGIVTATGSDNGAGIGGGGGGSGSNITISGGSVTATGGFGGGAGIGGGNSALGNGSNITISNSFVMASSISDTSSQDSWSGLIFNGEAGKVYGESFTISTDCTIPEGKTLVVAADQTISITETATFTNAGTIYNSGTFIGTVANSGTIHNAGSISGAPGGTIKHYSISIEKIENSCQSVELSLKVNDTAFEATVTYSLNEAEANAVIENGNTLKVADSGVETPIPVTATFTVDGVSMTRTEDVTITSGHVYDNNGFCTICNGYQPATDSDSDDVYEIDNAGQLYWFAALVNGTNGLTQNLSANAVLTADITVNTGDVANCGGTKQAGWKDWTPIVGNSYPNYYAGTFDGQNHTVSGLYFNNSGVDNVGLFGATGSSGKISKVGVVDSYFCGNERVGGVCGVKYGTMENCYSASTVSGANVVGGVCGDNCGSSQLINCYNTGAVNCSVSGGWYIGGVCGILNSGTIQNCYSTGTVSGSHTSVGGVCGQTQGTSAKISNCYFDSSKCDKNAVGVIYNGTVEKTEGKTTNQFASGEVAYLLNGEKSEGTAESPLAWYQNIDRDSETADTYPVLDSNHGTVYQCTPCTAVYSNTSGKTVAHTFHVDKNDNTKHTCEKCGATEAHSTTNFTYSADEEKKRITVYCNEGGCGANIGYVELAAPSGTITYDGTKKEATVSDTVDGVDFSTTPITYKQGETTLTSAPKDAGTYTASIALGTGEDAASVSVEYTIDKATPTISWCMLSGSTWVEMTSMPVTYTGSEIAPNKLVPPTVTLVNGETYSGEISYSYRVQGSSDAFTSGLPTAIGTYEVKASIAADGNYKEAASTVKLIVNWLNTTAAAVLTDQKNATLSGDTWWAQSVTFKAPNGFTISNSVDGTYGSSFDYNEQTDADGTEVTYYLKNSDGEIAQKSATVRVDKTAPTWTEDDCGISVKENWWKKLVNTISFGLFYKDATVDVKVCAKDNLSGIDAYYYYVDNSGNASVKTKEQLDALVGESKFTKYVAESSVSPLTGTKTLKSLSNEGNYVVYAYAIDMAGNRSDYVCSDGVVLDRTAPTIRDITTPSKAELTLTDTSAKISFTGSEAGTCFYIVKESSEDAPDAINDFATSLVDESTGMTVWTANEGVTADAMTADANNKVALTGLAANTAYTVYVIGVDRAGNASNVLSKEFTTCKTMPTITKNPTISGTYGQKVENMTLTPGTAKVGSTVITGTWVVTDSNKTAVPGVGTTATYQVTFTPDSDIYDTVIVPVKPTVSKKAITVTIDDKTKTYGHANPAFTYAITEGILVGTDTEEALGITLSCVANESSPVKAGGYAITGTSNSANYQVTVNRGVLTITKATPVITATTSYSMTYGDIKFFLDATDDSAEASLQYAVTESKDSSNTEVENDAIVSVDARGYVTIKGAGSAKITASIQETANYNAVSKDITIMVNKADNAPNMPGTSINASNRCNTVGDVPLPSGWVWQESYRDNELTTTVSGPEGIPVEIPVSATAEYIGADKTNYINTTVTVSITRSACDHIVGDILYNGNGEQPPTCTADGLGHRECTVCGATIESEIVVKAAHRFSSAWTIDVPATTTSEGSKSHHCSVCGEKNDVTVIPKLVISGGGDSGNAGDSSDNDGDNNDSGNTGSITDLGIGNITKPTIKPIVIPGSFTQEINLSPGIGNNIKPATNTEDNIEEPFIKGENGKEGWDGIRAEVNQVNDGDTVTVDMNGAAVVPSDVLSEIKGKDVTIVFDMGNGITWSVNGQSITGDAIGDIDFSVKTNTNSIPVDIINNITGERYSKQISLSYDGEFGFTAVLSINMEAENAGLFANLFYYNENTGEMEFICYDEIAEDGTANLTFTHASDYAIVIDKEPMDGVSDGEVVNGETDSDEEIYTIENDKKDTQDVTEAESKTWNSWWIIIICIVVIVIGLGAFIVIKKKKSENLIN